MLVPLPGKVKLAVKLNRRIRWLSRNTDLRRGALGAWRIGILRFECV